MTHSGPSSLMQRQVHDVALGHGQQPGAIVLFDEYNNFHRWQQHEFKAFQEFVERAGVRYEYIGFSVTGQQVAVRLLENPAFNA